MTYSRGRVKRGVGRKEAVLEEGRKMGRGREERVLRGEGGREGKKKVAFCEV